MNSDEAHHFILESKRGRFVLPLAVGCKSTDETAQTVSLGEEQKKAKKKAHAGFVQIPTHFWRVSELTVGLGGDMHLTGAFIGRKSNSWPLPRTNILS